MNFSGMSQKTVFGKIVRFPLRFIPKNMILPIPQGELQGYKWVVGSSTHGCWLGSYEFEKQCLISEVVVPGTVAFDIGAHVGYYTLLFSKLVGTSGRVFAFEPFPQNISYLKKHIQINQLSNVEVSEVAVAEANGRTFFKPHASSSMGYITKESEANTLEVSQVSLDELVTSGKVPPPSYIKMDIEGAEFCALEGAKEVLQQHHPVIFLATHGTEIHKSCCELLTSLGYKLTPIIGKDITLTDEILAK